MRHRRKRATWLPVLGSTLSSGETSTYAVAQEIAEFTLTADSSTPPAFGSNAGGEYFALIPDQTPQVSAHSADFTLRDYVEGQEFLLDSIVGTCDVLVGDGLTGQNEHTVWPSVCVTAGLLVGDADIEGGQVDADIEDSQIDPNSADNMASPWIWRRSWLMGTPHQPSGYPWPALPNINSYMTDGKGRAVETKSKRRIRRNQRIWFVISGYGFNWSDIAVSGTDNDQPRVAARLDLRVIGKMMRAKNQSAF